MQDAGVNLRGEQIVCGSDGMNVAREMEIEIFHRNNLRIAAARRAPFDAERRTHRGLPNAREYALLAMRAERLRKPCRRR